MLQRGDVDGATSMMQDANDMLAKNVSLNIHPSSIKSRIVQLQNPAMAALLATPNIYRPSLMNNNPYAKDATR